jgi:GH15 family glucan-1,4-alpha-glucosidase
VIQQNNAGFSGPADITENKRWEEGLSMLTITHTTVTRAQVWAAFRRAHDVLMEGKSCPESAQWLYRDEETMRTWVHAFHEAGLPGLERAPIPGRPA